MNLLPSIPGSGAAVSPAARAGPVLPGGLVPPGAAEQEHQPLLLPRLHQAAPQGAAGPAQDPEAAPRRQGNHRGEDGSPPQNRTRSAGMNRGDWGLLHLNGFPFPTLSIDVLHDHDSVGFTPVGFVV